MSNVGTNNACLKKTPDVNYNWLRNMGDETPNWLRTQLLGCVHNYLFCILCSAVSLCKSGVHESKKGFAANTGGF